MRYKSFFIKNFKGIQELNVPLDNIPNSEIVTLVGINESGKSTILEAFETFYQDRPLAESFVFIPKSRQLSFNDEVLLKATLILDKEDKQKIMDLISAVGFAVAQIPETVDISKRYIYQDSKPNSFFEDFEIRVSARKTKRQRTDSIIRKEDPVYTEICNYLRVSLPKIICYRNFLFDFPNKIYLENDGQKSADPRNIIYRSSIQDVLDSIALDNQLSSLSVQTHIVNRMRSTDPADKAALNQILTQIGEKITQVIFEAWDRIFSSSRKQIVVIPNIDPETDECFMEVNLKQGAQSYCISERSLGFKWFFTFLLFTEFRKNRSEDPGQTLFLLDEPASNLHSSAQLKLLNTFETLATEKCRLVYTTHSHHLINPKWLACAFVVINDALKDAENNPDIDVTNTKVTAELYKRYVAQSSKEQSYFQPILDALEYQPSKLEDVPNIIIVEGKNDYYTFRYINEIVLKGKYDLNFYPGAGAEKDEPIIRCYLAWGRDFAILRDADKPGKKAKTQYIKKLGELLNDKIFSFDDVSTSYDDCAAEDLFAAEERLTITNSSFPEEPSYNKSKFNASVQQLFIDETVIELSDDTLKKFEDIFKFLEGNL